MWFVDVFDVRGGYALCGRGGKYEKWKYIFARRQARPPARYHGICMRLVHGVPRPAPLRHPNIPGGRHESTIRMMERIHPQEQSPIIGQHVLAQMQAPLLDIFRLLRSALGDRALLRALR